MFLSSFFGLIAVLYYLGFLLLVGLALFIAFQSGQRTPQRLRRVFLLLALSLLTWQLTLFLEVRTTPAAVQLLLGRVNFAAVVFAAYFALRFVQEVPDRALGNPPPRAYWLLAETGLVTALTLLTPFVDAGERVAADQALTVYGALFPLYLLHMVGYLTAALLLAVAKRRRALTRRARGQLTLIGLGMLTTGGIALLTNALLPYLLGDFRYCDVGTLSTCGFVLAIAYATFIHRLFHLRFLLRKTLVYGLLLAFVLGGYSSAVFLITQFLTSQSDRPTRFAVLMIAFSFDPLRRFLEKKADRWLTRSRVRPTVRQKSGAVKRPLPASTPCLPAKKEQKARLSLAFQDRPAMLLPRNGLDFMRRLMRTDPHDNTPAPDNHGDLPGREPERDSEEFYPDVILTESGVTLPTLHLRAYALATGTLVDVSESAASVGFVYPVAVTKTLWDAMGAIPARYSHEQVQGRLWDVLSMAHLAIRHHQADASELLYQLVLHVEDRSAYTVKLTVGPGDHHEPVITLSSAEKDKDVPLGSVHITPGALDAFAEASVSPGPFLAAHKQGDWGDVGEHDRRANEEALALGERLVSAYTLQETQTQIWIITEWDRSRTTILLPSEY